MANVTVMEEFRRQKRSRLKSRLAEVHKFPKVPERPTPVEDMWVCGTCHEENTGTQCWKCGRYAD